MLTVEAHAQSSTTQCQTDYFGNVTCRTTADPSINWGLVKPAPNPGDEFNKAFREAQERKRQKERDDLLRQAIEQRAAHPPPASGAEGLAAACEREFGKALEAGKLELADAIAKICADKQP